MSREFTKRRLCPDGACTGILDDTGRCSECGRQGAGAARPTGGLATTTEATEASADDTDEPMDEPTDAASEQADDAGLAAAAPADGAAGGFDPARRLCPDGGCLGVIGKNDRCDTCGRGISG